MFLISIHSLIILILEVIEFNFYKNVYPKNIKKNIYDSISTYGSKINLISSCVVILFTILSLIYLIFYSHKKFNYNFNFEIFSVKLIIIMTFITLILFTVVFIMATFKFIERNKYLKTVEMHKASLLVK